MARKTPRQPDLDQPEFLFEIPTVTPVNEGPATQAPTTESPIEEAPKPLNRKQRRRVQFRGQENGLGALERANPTAPEPAKTEAPVVETPKVAVPVEKPAPAPRPATVAKPATAKPAAAGKVAIRPADTRQPTPFERLLHEQLAPVFNLCLRLTQDAAMADDLAQEVFVRAAKNLPEASSDAPDAETLILTAIDIFRRNRRYNRPRKPVPQETPENAHQPLPPVWVLPAAWAGLPEDHRDFLCALGTLEADDRVILVLKDVESRSYAGIADLLGAGETAVRSRVGKARERLHLALRRVEEGKKP